MPDADFIIILMLSAATITTAVIAVLQRNLIRAVIAFAVSSICLAALFFVLASPYAGALELTVGAGLVAVLFLVALVLAGGEEEKVRT
jgi:NADH:ubiquinone oxidoreductase subunit 6 (subunit J)